MIEDAVMPVNHREIVSDIKEHIQKFGSGLGEWCVGTAKDSHGPSFQSHRAAELGDGFIYREAFTPTSTQEARDCLGKPGTDETFTSFLW